MIKREQVAVIVPTYKAVLSETEYISLQQLFKVLGHYDIWYVIPEKLDAEYLTKAMVKRFPDAFFKSIAGYNRLMLSTDFYRCFTKYKYILIYQLDALVFSDLLLEFCNLGYDYIGAPWLTGMSKREGERYIYVKVGNGGFSLRNVHNTICLLERKKEELKEYSDSEDKFFAFNNSDFFRIAPVSHALKFAFEREVEKCMELNRDILPFGCHAWERYNYSFWKPYIERQGYELPVQNSRYGMEDIINIELYKKAALLEKFWTFDANPEITLAENRKKAIFGIGMYGKRVLEIMENADISVDCFFDNNEEVQGKYIKKYVVYSPEILAQDDTFFTILAISGDKLNTVREQLNQMGKQYMQDYIIYTDLVS